MKVTVYEGPHSAAFYSPLQLYTPWNYSWSLAPNYEQAPFETSAIQSYESMTWQRSQESHVTVGTLQDEDRAFRVVCETLFYAPRKQTPVRWPAFVLFLPQRVNCTSFVPLQVVGTVIHGWMPLKERAHWSWYNVSLSELTKRQVWRDASKLDRAGSLISDVPHLYFGDTGFENWPDECRDSNLKWVIISLSLSRYLPASLQFIALNHSFIHIHRYVTSSVDAALLNNVQPNLQIIKHWSMDVAVNRIL